MVTSALGDCNHNKQTPECSSTCIMLLLKGHTEAFINTVGSDIVILTIHHYQNLNPSKVWIGFGVGKHYEDIPIYIGIAWEVGPDKS